MLGTSCIFVVVVELTLDRLRQANPDPLTSGWGLFPAGQHEVGTIAAAQ